MTIEFTAFDRPRRLASATDSSMMDTVGAIAFDRASDGTRMSWSWDMQHRGVLRLMAPVVGLVGRRQERRISGNLKRLLESEASPRTNPMNPGLVAGLTRVLVAYASEQGATELLGS